MKLNSIRIFALLLFIILVSLHSGCSIISKENRDKSNVASNENGSSIPPETIETQKKPVVENPLQVEKKEGRADPSRAGKQIIEQDNDKETQTDDTQVKENNIMYGKEQQTVKNVIQSKDKGRDTTPSHIDIQDQSKKTEKAIQVISQPEAITVLVNKQNKLPDNYAPKDLVYPNVRFIFRGNLEKKKMRKDAARALEKMFAGAEADGIQLAGVSGYRSQNTQERLYNRYVRRDGKAAADRYSAYPSHSEHQTGLAMDVSGISGKCAAMDCFGSSPEAFWLAEHSHEYGFIIRYPKGKEHITGYQYEPWHMRYVGTDISTEIYEKDIALEEYFDTAVPVSGNKTYLKADLW